MKKRKQYCFYCKKTGHFKAQCYTLKNMLKKNKKTTKRKRNDDDQEKKKKKKFFICGNITHGNMEFPSHFLLIDNGAQASITTNPH